METVRQKLHHADLQAIDWFLQVMLYARLFQKEIRVQISAFEV